MKGVKEILSDLDLANNEIALKMNIGKTKLMTNLLPSENLTVNNLDIQQVYYYKHLRHQNRLGKTINPLQ